MKVRLLGILMCAFLVLGVTAQGHAFGFGDPVSAVGSCMGAGNILTTISVANPVGIVADPTRGVVYVTNFTKATVSVIDEKTNTVTATIPVGSYPYCMALDPFRGKVYVVNYLGGGSVSVIDQATNTVTATITGIGNGGHGVAVDPFRGKVYVVTVGATMKVIDETSLTVTNTITMPTSVGGVAVDPITGNIYAAINPGTKSSVEVFDPTTLALTATVPLTTPQLDGIVVDPIGKKVYAAGSNAYDESAVGALFVIDTTSNTLINTIPGIRNTTASVAFDPVNRKLYVTSTDYDSYEGGVMVIDAVSETFVDTFTLNAAGNPAIDPIRRTLYVTVENGANAVDVISIGGPMPWGKNY